MTTQPPATPPLTEDEISRSPVLQMWMSIAGAPFRIAPERESELADWDNESGFEMVLVDEPLFGIRVNTTTAVCTVPIASLEHLWVCAYAFVVFYDEYNKAQARQETTFDISALQVTREAWELLGWSQKNLRDKGTARWPEHLPRPLIDGDPKSVLKVADELFLCAIAWIFHHEIAHVRNRDQHFDDAHAIEQERRADREATEWILSKSAVAKESRKRLMGIATAILAFQTLETPGSKTGFRTHPEAFQRLYDNLGAFEIGFDEDVYAFAAVLLQIQAAQHGIVADLDAPSFRDLFESLLVKVAQHRGSN